MLSGDPEKLYFERMEKAGEEVDQTSSGLGYLSMMVDYDAKIAWKFETQMDWPKAVFVTTMIKIGI